MSQSLDYHYEKPINHDNSNYIDIKKGDIIIHNRFGRGEVVQTDGLGSDKKAEVEFETSGIKKILLKFAKYEIIK